MATRVQRLRLTFARDDGLKYITHLDVMRAWERALRRAQLPVAYSEGFTPRPRIAIAAPLAVGVTSECELLELFCSERIPLARVQHDLPPQLPNGIRLLRVDEVPLGLPSLQSLMRAAEYDVEVEDARSPQAWQQAMAELLGREAIPWEHQRGDEVRRYDLRPLILGIELLPVGAGAAGSRRALRLRLRSDERGAGRPEQVTRALGLTVEPVRIHRTRLEIEEPAIARTAYRAAGRRAD